ncbi:MAG TPA: cupin domain-containing protein [Rhizomicrobium sp.]|nr:cupin domain-containing protein [Rhizomicrobium sp.]
MNMTLAAIILAALPSTMADKTASDTAARLVAGKEISETLRKGMTPDALFSQVLLAKRDGYEIHITTRDKSGLAEIHENWSDHIFIQEGEASFIIGGTVPDAKVREPGEKRGTAIIGGHTMAVRAGDYLFIPPGTPHQMIVKSGQRATFIGLRTHK